MVKNKKSWPLRVLGVLSLDSLIGIARKDVMHVLASLTVITQIVNQKVNFGA